MTPETIDSRTSPVRTDAEASPPSGPPLGAHVSIAGGLHRAPPRAVEIGATAMQIFTRQPQRWAEPELVDEDYRAYREALEETEVGPVASHDTYLINLASEKKELFEKSFAAFEAELVRCIRLGIDFVVTHPGNATGGDRDAALARNADAIGRALEKHPGDTRVLVETTAGSGTALGWRFEELARLIEAVPPSPRERVGVCLDTAHVFAAGYDLKEDYAGVMDEFGDVIGFERLRLFHLNDSKSPLGSRVDRHTHIGEGELGDAPFRHLMRDARFDRVPRVLETPKDGDATTSDRRNLARLRELARGD